MDPIGGAARAVRVSLVPGSAPGVLGPILVGGAVDGSLQRHGAIHATLRPGQAAVSESGADGSGPGAASTPPVAVLLLPLRHQGRGSPAAVPDGAIALEVVVDGWRFEVLVEDAARADLRERATRGRVADASSRPAGVRAMIPGRVASVAAAVGDAVEEGSPLLVIEAMKMQNEIQCPMAGKITSIRCEQAGRVEQGAVIVEYEPIKE